MKGILAGEGFADRAGVFLRAGLDLRSIWDPSAPPPGGAEFAAISLPPKAAGKAALTALRSGLHVLCSPPFCVSTAELEELREAAGTAGRTIFPLQPWEKAPALRGLEKALDDRLAGEIDYVSIKAAYEGAAAEPELWQVFSLLLCTARRPPAAIEARMPEGGPMAFHVHFPGADGFAHVSRGEESPWLSIRLSGKAGRIETDGRSIRLDVKGVGSRTVEFQGGLEPGRTRHEWLAAELADFRAEADGELPRGSGLRNARYCVKLLRNAAYSASVRSAAVPL